jgi:hypothetical protein
MGNRLQGNVAVVTGGGHGKKRVYGNLSGGMG